MHNKIGIRIMTPNQILAPPTGCGTTFINTTHTIKEIIPKKDNINPLRIYRFIFTSYL